MESPVGIECCLGDKNCSMIGGMRLGLVLSLFVVFMDPGTIWAQDDDESHPSPSADELADERLVQRGERYAEGMWVFSYGLGSILIGGIIASVAHDDPFWLGAGLGTATWGAINVWFGLPMMDLGGGLERRIEEERALRGGALRARREDLASDQYGGAAMFAFNGGLDVFYIASGIFLAVLGSELLEPRFPELTGYGIAMAAQGVGLLIFDVFGWIRAAERGNRLQRLGRW